MSEKEPKAPAPVAAGIQLPQEGPPKATFLDLSEVPTWGSHIAAPQFSIPWTGYVGRSTVRGAEEIKLATQARRLASPIPAALIIATDNENPQVLYGVPASRQKPSYLALEWTEQNRMVKANFQAILRAKEITIPQGMKLIILVEHIHHAELKDCVKLSWSKESLVPIQEAPEGESKS